MQPKIDIHDHQAKYLHYMGLVKGEVRNREGNVWELNQKQRETFVEFADNCLAEDITPARIVRYINDFKAIQKQFPDFSLDLPEQELVRHLKEVAGWITTSNYAESTKAGFRTFLKKYVKTMKGEDWAFKNMRWLKTNLKRKHEKLPGDLLTEEEILKVLDCFNLSRDRALYMVMYETAGRVSEIASLRIKDVELANGDSQVNINYSKTKPRILPIKASVPFLKEWLRCHPRKNEPDAPLFCNTNQNVGQPMIYNAIRKTLMTAMKKSGLGKNANPHLLRHSRLTFLAGYLTDSQLASWAGWTGGSKMVQTYIHLSKKHLKDAFNQIYGQGVQEKKKESILKPILCQTCGHENEAGLKYCFRCSNPLSLSVALEHNQVKEVQSSVLNSLDQETIFQLMDAWWDNMKRKEANQIKVQGGFERIL